MDLRGFLLANLDVNTPFSDIFLAEQLRYTVPSCCPLPPCLHAAIITFPAKPLLNVLGTSVISARALQTNVLFDYL